MAENISPEERLFNVIQRGKQPAPGSGESGDKKPGLWASLLKRFMPPGKPQMQEEKKGFDWKKIFPASIKLPELEAAAINKILILALFVTTIFFTKSLLTKQKDATKIADTVSKIHASSSLGMKKVEPFKALNYYLGEIRNRDIFRPAPKGVTTGARREVSDSLKKAAENLKLKGVSWGETPKAMILWQDDKDSKIYFLTEGQEIGTMGIKVKEIYRNKVKIGDDKEEMELL
jgi:hypothetical protein